MGKKSDAGEIGFVLDDVLEKFPELKESEDERIRKEIITFIVTTPKERNNHKKWIAWLEAQGEHDNFRNKIQIGDKVTRNEDGVLVNLSQLNRVAKKQDEQKPTEWHREDEQNLNACLGYIPDEFLRRWLTDIIHIKYDKPADKVEPKIKAGDWVVCNNSPHHIFQVIERSWPNAKYRNINGTELFLNVNTLDKQYHLWTIQDAKDGDVLACNEEILLFKSYSVQGRISLYCWYNGQTNNFHNKEVTDASLTTRNKICPATKEQHDFLFQKMKEAGYEWDAEKKELKKIVQKPAWSEEDEERLNSIIESYKDLLKDYKACHDVDYIPYNSDTVIRNVVDDVNFLESLKDKVQPQPRQEWSEEDELMLMSIIQTLKSTNGAAQMKIDWLESLRPQSTWKPSDEQIEMLENVRKILHTNDIYSKANHLMYNFEELIRTLKKLKDEK